MFKMNSSYLCQAIENQCIQLATSKGSKFKVRNFRALQLIRYTTLIICYVDILKYLETEIVFKCHKRSECSFIGLVDFLSVLFFMKKILNFVQAQY